MGSIPISRLLTLAAIGAVVAVWAGPGFAGPDRSEPHAVLTGATGDLHVWNSRDGQAIFQFTGLAPGQSVSGTVQLKNTGSMPGDLSLEQLDVQDLPGANGGLLSNAVQLDIRDITGGNSVPTFTGPVSGLSRRQLGGIGPSAVRVFRFEASLPDGGVPPSATGGDNAYAGSGVTMRYAWNTSEGGLIGPSGPEDRGRGGRRNGPLTHNRPWVKFHADARRLLKRGWLDVFARCNRGCTLTVGAKTSKKTGVALRQKIVTLPLPFRTARIRLKLNQRNRHALMRVLRHRKRVVLQVEVKLVAAGWSEISTHRKSVSVKRPKAAHRGR
jgi:spore coat-associated protein N